MSFSRLGQSVTRRAGTLLSVPFTQTSPKAITAITLPSGLSAASLASDATDFCSKRSPASSVAVTDTSRGWPPPERSSV